MAEALTAPNEEQRQKWIRLIELFYQQIRYGCTDVKGCDRKSCLCYQNRISGRRPYRIPARPTAKHLATILASEPDAVDHLCIHKLRPMKDGDGAFVEHPATDKTDDKSLVQLLYSTQAWHRQKQPRYLPGVDAEGIFKATRALIRADPPARFEDLVQNVLKELIGLERNDRIKAFPALCEMATVEIEVAGPMSSNGAHDERMLFDSLITAMAILVAFASSENLESPQDLDHAISGKSVFSVEACDMMGKGLLEYIDVVENRTASRLALQVLHALYAGNLYQAFFCRISPRNKLCRAFEGQKQQLDLHSIVAFWAKLVFRNTWQLTEFEIDESCDAHVAVYFLDKFLSYLSGWLHVPTFRKELTFVSQSNDPAKTVEPWMKSQLSPGRISLLDYPWMFDERDRFIMFRHANYTLMLDPFEKSMKAGQMMVRMHGLIRDAASDQMRYQQIRDRMRPAATVFLVLQVRRENVLEDTLSQLWRRECRELRRPLKIKMGMDMGEEGIDLGGVQQEFFRLAVAKAMDPDLGFFNVDPTTKMAWFRPFSPATLIQYALIGMLFGLAVYNSITLPVTFPNIFYRILMAQTLDGLSVSLDDIEGDFEVLHRSLKALKEYAGSDFEDVFALDFSFPVDLTGKTIALDMTRDVPLDVKEAVAQSNAVSMSDFQAVTNDNRDDYIKQYLSWQFHKSVQRQINAFLRGFNAIVVPKTLSLFDRNGQELRDMVEGVQHIDVMELKSIVKYLDGYDRDSDTIRSFWEVVEEYSQDELRRLLEFVTASERIPAAGMEGMAFIVQKNGTDDERLPTSMTCFGRLLLPRYSSKEVLRDRLHIAIENCEGFGVA